ncbi:hypothetical protein BS47DRAFT_1352132 [Hydnum rufescens UP504]|uniref:ZZ-type domain-containing protein n=1 Tax=Hydnum rufescens UP504 TaxID=1448309 RepID=A0A9P6AK42_9AGAM|nr:hypothetical protein BS47DRAFT_1352132 [Hydnum rufescens UP504]
MTFTVKAEYAGITRRLTFPTFPSWDDLHNQLCKVFRVDQYYLSNLTLSANTPGDSTRLRIASEVRSGAQYKDHVSPFLTQDWRNGFLRFTVCDIKPRKEPSSWNRRSPSQGPMDIDDEDTSQEPPVPPKPWWFRSKDDVDDVPRTPHWAAHAQGAFNVGHNYVPRWAVPHRSRGLGRTGSRALPTLPRVAVNRPPPITSTGSPASTPKEEIHSMLSSFVTQLNDTLAKHGITDAGVLLRASSPTPEKPVHPTPERDQVDAFDAEKLKDSIPNVTIIGAPPVVWCDSCSELVKGTRYKCANCANYDLCHRCVKERDAKAKHNVYHYFTEMPPDHKANIDVAPTSAPQNGPESTIVHHATCDVCGDTIHGVRHKCSECPDYDMCSPCYTNYRGAHRLEHKFNMYCNPADLPVASNVKNGVSVTSRPLVDVSPPSSPPVSTSTAIDSNSLALSVHPAFCDVCGLGICGIRHKCLDCPDYDMCNDCHSYLRHMHHGMHTFVKIPKPTRVVVHRVYDHGTQEDLEEQPSDEKDNAAAVHDSICDVCDKRIIGVRHKCLDCADYDMCDPCMNTRRYEAHDDSHNFARLGTPGTVIVHRVLESSLGPASATETESPPSVPVSPLPTRVAMATGPFAHAARCNMCDSRILGNRYKCVGCPDFDTCSSCFTITPEQHPHHAFVKVSKPEDIVTPPMEQFTTVHPAVCDICHNHIIGIRFKCLHPECPDVDLCQHCEALPIPSHPASHPLVKFKHDYVRDPLSYEAVFGFVEQTRLQSKVEGSLPVPPPSAVPPPVVSVSPIPCLSATPQVEVILPRATHPDDIGENYFPRVPTDEPRGLVASAMEVSMDGGPGLIQFASVPSMTLQGNSFGGVSPAAASPAELSASEISQPTNALVLEATFMPDCNAPDGHTFPAGAEFVQTWVVRNSGKTAWPETTELEFVGGLRLGAGLNAPSVYPVGCVEPGGEVEVHAHHMKAPEVSGEYQSQWRLTDGNGRVFGDKLFCDIQVDTPTSDKSMSSSSIVMMPGSAPEETDRADMPAGLPVPHPEREASVLSLTSSPPGSPASVATTLSEAWTSPRPILRHEISTEFVFVEDEELR